MQEKTKREYSQANDLSKSTTNKTYRNKNVEARAFEPGLFSAFRPIGDFYKNRHYNVQNESNSGGWKFLHILWGVVASPYYLAYGVGASVVTVAKALKETAIAIKHGFVLTGRFLGNLFTGKIFVHHTTRLNEKINQKENVLNKTVQLGLKEIDSLKKEIQKLEDEATKLQENLLEMVGRTKGSEAQKKIEEKLNKFLKRKQAEIDIKVRQSNDVMTNLEKQHNKLVEQRKEYNKKLDKLALVSPKVALILKEKRMENEGVLPEGLKSFNKITAKNFTDANGSKAEIQHKKVKQEKPHEQQK